MTRSSKFATTLVVALAMVVLGATGALAAPHFASATASINNAGALVVSFDERGLGNGNVDYTLTADATATYGCFNGGGNHPKAANKETSNDDVSGGGTFQAKNGRVRASLMAGPISAGAFDCPGGQRLRLASVSYSNILLTDTTNDESTGVTPDPISRTFFTV
jgi:hypothetical protein